MALSVPNFLATQLPADFRARLLSVATSGTDPVTGKTYNLPTRSWEPGDPTRTEIVTIAETLARYFGVAATIGGTGDAVGQDSVLVTFCKGGLLRWASDVTPDPSLPNPDGTYPLAGNGFLDAVASDLYNVARAGLASPNSPINNGGPGVESNASLVERCFAKLDPEGLLFEDGSDPYVYFAKSPSAGGAYAGAPLSQPVTRGQVDVAEVVVTLYLANAGGSLPGPDQQAEHDFLQQRCTPTGIVLIVLPASPVLVSVSLDVWAPATVGAVQANTDVTAAIARYFSTLDIGGAEGASGSKGVILSALEAFIFEQVPYVEDIENLLFNGAASDVVLTTGQVAIPFPPTITVHLT